MAEILTDNWHLYPPIQTLSWHWDVRKGCHGNFVISHVKLQIDAEISRQN